VRLIHTKPAKEAPPLRQNGSTGTINATRLAGLFDPQAANKLSLDAQKATEVTNTINDGPRTTETATAAYTETQFVPVTASSSTPLVRDVAHTGLITPEPTSASLTGGANVDPLLNVRQANNAYRDGRVRDPIPSKLKGKTDQKKGNFNVMHMDVNRGVKEDRYDAAKRNSESTALQAKMAETDRYVSHHRRANYSRPKTSSRKSAGAETQPPVPLGPARPLSPLETKTEQVRLLTLLRTLPHAQIVDQICKAVAFFGGIPDAPPPADGKFPESYEGNGSGSLFVGWFAEIFPDQSRPPRPREPALAAEGTPVIVSGKRPRGRPKGSKAQKPRKDKGTRKKPHGPRNHAIPDGTDAALARDERGGADENWVDIDGTAVTIDEFDGDGDTVERRLLQLLGGSSGAHENGGPDATVSGGSAVGEVVTPVRKRGRPKGSKNRPKPVMAGETVAEPLAAPPPLLSPRHPLPGQQSQASSDTGATAKQGPLKKSGAGRPKGSKNKPKATSNDASQTTSLKPQPDAGPRPPISTTHIPPPTLPVGTTAHSQAATDVSEINSAVHRTGKGPATALTVKESTITGAKRKRQSNNDTVQTSDDPVMVNESPVPVPAPVGELTQPPASAAEMSTVIAHGPKRQRVSTTSNNKRQNASNAAAASKGLPADMMDSTLQMDIAAQSVQRTAPAMGLDAHLERFQALNTNNDDSQDYGNRQRGQQQRTASASRQSLSSAPAEGLDAHIEHFSKMQNTSTHARPQASLPPSTQQRQQQQQQQQRQLTSHSTSPTPSQILKPPMITTSVSQQGSARVAPNYFAPNQTPSYSTQQVSYGPNQRQQHSMSPSVTNGGMVQQSSQFASGSPQLNVHNAGTYGTRRTASNSSMDNSYRQPSTGTHQSSSFGTSSRQTPNVASFQSFAGDATAFLDMQDLGSAGSGHANMAMGSSGGYPLGSHARTNSGTSTSLYGTTGTMTNGNVASGLRGQSRGW
jgi:hypothetical protein